MKSDLRGPPSLTPVYWFDPSTVSIKSTANAYLPVGHPDNPFSADNQVARLYYADGGLGGIGTQYTTDTQRYLLGLKGTHAGWDWDIAGLYIRTTTDITIENAYQADRFLAGLAGTGPYGYYRIGAAAPLNNPAIYDWIAPDLSYKTTSENTVVDAKASRDLYKLGGGQLALAVGYEFRREELNNPGVPGAATGEVVGGSQARAFGARNVNALYADLRADPRQPRSHGRHPLRPLLGRGQHLEPESRRQVGGRPVAGAARHVADRVSRPGSVRNEHRERIRRAAERRRSGALPGYADRSRLPGQCPRRHHRQSRDPARNVDQLYARRDLGTGPGLERRARLLELRGQGPDHHREPQATFDNPSAFPNAEIGRGTDDLPGIPNSGTLIYIKSPYQNANSVKTDGIDLDVVWKWNLKDYGTLTTELQWTHVFGYDQTFANGETYKYADAGQLRRVFGIGDAGGPDEPDRRLAARAVERRRHDPLRERLHVDAVPGVPIPEGCLSHSTPSATHRRSPRSTCRRCIRGSRAGRSSGRSSTCSTGCRRSTRPPATAPSTTTTTTRFPARPARSSTWACVIRSSRNRTLGQRREPRHRLVECHVLVQRLARREGLVRRGACSFARELQGVFVDRRVGFGVLKPMRSRCA